jgi:hypothetical protein
MKKNNNSVKNIISHNFKGKKDNHNNNQINHYKQPNLNNNKDKNNNENKNTDL